MIWFGFRRFLWSAVFSVRAVGSPFVASGPCEDDQGGAERPLGEKGAGQVQRGRHHRRPQEAGGGADRDAPRQDPEVVQHLQGPHHPQGLRDPRRHGPRALLQLASPPPVVRYLLAATWFPLEFEFRSAPFDSIRFLRACSLGVA